MPEPFDAQYEAIQAKFRSSLGVRLGELESSWDEGQKGSQPAFVHLHLLSHQLAGACATFGLAALGHAAQSLEHLTLPLRDRLPAESERDALEVAFMALKALFLDATSAAANPASPREDRPEAGSTASARVLFLLEDDPAQAEEVIRSLKPYGYSVRHASNLGSLQGLLEGGPPDAVLMDVMLPEDPLGGPKGVVDIKFPPGCARVFFSARDDLEARAWAVKAGGEAFFTKPVEACLLAEVLEQLQAREETRPFKILLLDDDRSQAEYHALLLSVSGHQCHVIQKGEDLLDALAAHQPDLLILDHYLPRFTGLDLAKVLRQMPMYQTMPIIFLSTERNTSLQGQGLRAGADDFLTKPVDPGSFVATVSARISRARTLRSLASMDSLTGLSNHSHLLRHLEGALAEAGRQKRDLAFAMIDVDHFKEVNDTHGHANGDRVLQALSRLLRQRLRKTDLPGRWGGEEFGIVLPDTPLPVARKVIETLLEAFQCLYFTGPKHAFQCTFSGGVAAFPAIATRDALVEAADKALYDAKSAGRCRVMEAR